MQYANAAKAVRKMGELALGRHIHCHLFRASDITNTSAKGIPDAINKAIHWGNQDTKYLSTYTLLKNDQIDDWMKRRAGIEVERPEDKSKPVQCPACFTLNNPFADFCITCGAAISKKAIAKKLEEERCISLITQAVSKEELISHIDKFLVDNFPEYSEAVNEKHN